MGFLIPSLAIAALYFLASRPRPPSPADPQLLKTYFQMVGRDAGDFHRSTGAAPPEIAKAAQAFFSSTPVVGTIQFARDAKGREWAMLVEMQSDAAGNSHRALTLYEHN